MHNTRGPILSFPLQKPHPAWVVRFFVCLLLGLLLAACNTAIGAADSLQVTLHVDGADQSLTLPAGSTVQSAIQSAGILTSTLDRVEPPPYTVLTNGDRIEVIRVREEFDVEEKILPFERQQVRNESLPDGKYLLVQPGVNGKQQITYRRVLENDVEVSRAVFKTVTLAESQPEIMMVGVQAPFSPVDIRGRLAYLIAGNAWVMETSTGLRRPVVSTGDLDGRIFTLSPDGRWLLFTRKPGPDQTGFINTLWAVDTENENPRPLDLNVRNIVHHAAFIPGQATTITYSTVEPRETAPGWLANNDLFMLRFSEAGIITINDPILSSSVQGFYGWWGTQFEWSPDGLLLAYASPDSVGLVDIEKKELVPLMDVLPLETGKSWAWLPQLAWSPDHQVLFTVAHVAKPGQNQPETSPLFDLTAIPMESRAPIAIGSQTGMFAYPVPSPARSGRPYSLAYLQAIFSEQSDTSRYRLMIADRDGSNRRALFPADGSSGLDPQRIVWEPAEGDLPSSRIAFIANGNLWLLDVNSGEARQLTGDGLISRVDWN